MKILKPKYYLNTKLKPKKNGLVDEYPVYLRFTIGKNNHRLKSNLLGYLNKESDLLRYQKEIDLETDVLNYLYSRFHDYSFENFASDSFYLCSDLNVIFSMHFYNFHSEHYGNATLLEYYMIELTDYISNKTSIDYSFIESILKEVSFDTIIPINFVANKAVKDVLIAFNSCISYMADEKNDILCIYNWMNTDISEKFKLKYGLKSTQIVDNIVRIYKSSINSKLDL